MTIKRINLSFYMGSEYRHASFEDEIASEACRLAGGCTVSNHTGYWNKGAESPQFVYEGEKEIEYCLKIELLVFEHSVDRIYSYMRASIAQAARRYIPSMRWVHVTRCPVDALHFDIRLVQL